MRVTVHAGEHSARVVGTVVGSQARPHLLEAWGQRFNLQLTDCLALFRYEDRPGVIGEVGTAFGKAGVNIDSAAVGHVPGEENGAVAVMVVTTTTPVPEDVVDGIVGAGGYLAGRAVTLA